MIMFSSLFSRFFQLMMLMIVNTFLIACQAPPINQFSPSAVNLVQTDGTYPTHPLEKTEITLKLIQNSVKNITTISEADTIIQQNLDHVTELILKACSSGEQPDIILLHEFPLTGYLSGDRQDKMQMALQIPGSQSDVLAGLARDCDTYIIFGSYATDPEWPAHILSLTTIIDRQGKIVKKVWKPRNIKRFYAEFEITTTTVESVRERFIRQYGIDDEFPVIQTEFGNIAVSTAQLDPLVFAAFAMKGAEIILRTSTYFFESDVIATALSNNVYSAMSNIPGKPPYGGNSMVVSPNGQVMARLDHQNEGILTTKIPIAKFRHGRKLPQYSVELTRSIFNQYREEIASDHLDLPIEKLPKNGKQMKTYLDEISRW